MVLDDVAKKTFFFKEMAAASDADVFGHCDLNVVDVFVIPERFKDRIGKAEDE